MAELSRLQAADWERVAHTADGGLLTLAAWAGALADEDDAHLAAVEALLLLAP